MNIVNKLTIRHLKKNKRRTLVTIIGVIISVAMVTAVMTLGASFLDLLKRQAISMDGEWHVVYKDVNKEQIEIIQSDKETKKLVLSSDLGYAPLEGSQNVYKPYLFVKAFSSDGFKQFPVTLSEGRLPENENEMVISDSIESNGKVSLKIGDQLTLPVGNRMFIDESGTKVEYDQQTSLQMTEGEISEELQNQVTREYTVVGVMKRVSWEPTFSPGYTVITYLDDSRLDEIDQVNAVVVLEKVNKSLFKHAEQLAKENNISRVDFNSALLRYHGVTDNDGLNRTLYSLLAIIMSVIMIGSVALIYNAFAISVSERARHLGMLSSVGATKRQKRNSVFFEGIIIGLISIPIGLLSGIVGMGVTFWFINQFLEGALGVSEPLKVTITPYSMIGASVISMITIFISTFIPARKASKITAIDAIRQTSDIKLTSKAVKTSKWIRRMFGLEAEIGLKNLKRNKGRYRVTVFSLVISIVLFLSVSFFTDSLKKSLVLSQGGVNYDIQVGADRVSETELADIFGNIQALPDVTSSSVTRRLDLTTLVEKEKVADELKGTLKYEDGKAPYFLVLTGLDEESLKKYTDQVGIDVKPLTDPEHISGIVVDTITYQDGQTGKFIEASGIHAKVGESIKLMYDDYKAGEKIPLEDLEIAALTEQLPMGGFSYGLGTLNIIVSNQVIDQLMNESIEGSVQPTLFLKSSDPMKTQQEIEEMKKPNLSIFNVYQSRQREEQMLMLLSVFTYGFIVLITAISIANIFNTISTGISLRKREFAMLKSVGMTEKGFNKMISYESIFYGLKALLYGLPISLGIMFLIYKGTMNTFTYPFWIPWGSLGICFVSVFVIVSSAMLYSIAKVKKDNIIEVLRQENI
ncbi:FtsX-like permease family protein [Robertmurraya korlensis]|uniref:ABC transporter permease n=1 Tax=Robertmurraya korlensis TaxID=519977 RepID=UPI0020414D43|nr:FtsX-like permease family protein [Robertmurraya korlensis]